MPMPWRCAVGSTSSSMSRVRIEYGGCSVRKRSRPRSRAIHCASTISAPGVRRGAGVADLAFADEVGQRAERLLNVGVRRRAVDVVEVDVVGAEPTQRVLDLVDDPASGATALVGVLAHRHEELGGEHDIVTAALEGLADDLLRLASRVDVGGVNEVDALVQG